MSQHYYADGAKHYDHHKEMNVQLNGNVSEEKIAELVKGFFADNEVVDAEEVEEIRETLNDNVAFGAAEDVEIPSSVKEVFVQPVLIEKYVRAMMENHYDGSPLTLALIYCVLNDYSLIRSVGKYRNFVKSLIDWGLLPPMTDIQQKALADGVSGRMRDRNDHGKLRLGLGKDFRHWEDSKKRLQCETIASVFGKEDDYFYPDGTIHYKHKR